MSVPAPGPGTAGSGDDDSGQVTILVIGFAVVCLLLTVVVMGVTAVYLGERKLQVLADNAALAAADTFVELHPGQEEGASPVPVLDDAAVAGAAAGYLDTVRAWDATTGLAVAAPTGSPDGRTAQVTLSAVVHPPVVNLLVPDGVAVTATGQARAQLGR